MKKDHLYFDSILIATFLVGIFLPLLLTDTREISQIEKRKLTPFPEWRWDGEALKSFTVAFQEYFNDHFGLRNYFARGFSSLAVMLGSSPKDSMLLIGKDSWHFYILKRDGNNLEDFRKNDGLSSEELQQWKSALETKYNWLKQKGIDYLFVIAPNKHSIYPEYYPARIRPVGTQSRLDQFMEYMRDSEVPVLDLRPALIQAKPEGLLYYKFGTHWNDFGAAVAQYAIMQHIAQGRPAITPVRYNADAFIWNTEKGETWDLSIFDQKQIVPRLHTPLLACEKQFIEKNPVDSDTATFMTSGPSSGPVVLIFRDSFFTALQPYISTYFSKSIYVDTGQSAGQSDEETFRKYVEQYHPGVVIEELVERWLYFNAFSEISLWFHAGKVAYHLPDDHEQGLTPLHRIKILPAEHGYSLVSEGEDSYLTIPEFKIDAAKKYILRAVLHSPQKTLWKILYDTPQKFEYGGGHSRWGTLQPGDNTFYAVLDSKDLQGQMQIRIYPGSAGEYRLESLEVRAEVPNGGRRLE